MRVLVTFALEAEFAPWRNRHPFVPVRVAGLTLYRAQIAEAEVAVLLAGVGGSAGACVTDAMTGLLDRDHGFDVCISSGLAGALRPEHLPGEVLAPRELRSHRVYSGIPSGRLACDASLVELAGCCGAKIVESFYTAERILISVAEKSALARTADAVEMESFDVVKEACARGARAVAIRAVSDAAGEDLPLDFNRTLAGKGRVNVSKVLFQLARRPQALPQLLRFARQSRRAAESLADCLDRYIEALARQPLAPRFEEVAAT
jgi:adenosylhomocysteine nucleosidase